MNDVHFYCLLENVQKQPTLRPASLFHCMLLYVGNPVINGYLEAMNSLKLGYPHGFIVIHSLFVCERRFCR